VGLAIPLRLAPPMKSTPGSPLDWWYLTNLALSLFAFGSTNVFRCLVIHGVTSSLWGVHIIVSHHTNSSTSPINTSRPHLGRLGRFRYPRSLQFYLIVGGPRPENDEAII